MDLTEREFFLKYSIIPAWVLNAIHAAIRKREKGLLAFVLHDGGIRNAHKTQEVIHPEK